MRLDTSLTMRLIVVAIIMSLTLPVAGAQEIERIRSGVGAPPGTFAAAAPSVIAAVPSSLDPLTVTLASAILPGSGQLLLRQKRAAAYLALEAAAVAF